MASATIATKYGTAPRNTWDGTEKIPLDVGGADGVGLASTLKTYMIGAGSVAVTTGKTLTVTNDVTLAGSPPTLAANTFTDTQTITPAAANASALVVSGFSLTGTDTHSLMDLAGTWNVGTTVETAVKLTMTDTASGVGSLFLDLKVGATSKFSIRKDGAITVASSAAFTGVVTCAGLSNGVTVIENLNVPVTGVTFHGRDGTTAPGGATFFRAGNSAATAAGGALTVSGGLAAGADQAGGLFTLNGGQGTGTGVGGDIVLQTAKAAVGTGSSANALAEVLRVLSTGLVKFTNAANFTANATTATVMTSLGPAGASTTIAEWLTIQNASGTVRYIPCY